jgi:hypothetical protein
VWGDSDTENGRGRVIVNSDNGGKTGVTDIGRGRWEGDIDRGGRGHFDSEWGDSSVTLTTGERGDTDIEGGGGEMADWSPPRVIRSAWKNACTVKK